MHSPSIDIIVPVWNSPFEARACLAAILAHSPEVRLVVVDNGSSRETERMLEEFSDPLDDNGLFVKSERNIGLVRAINMGLDLSDSDYAVIVRPHVLVSPGWLDGLIDAAKDGMATPLVDSPGVRHNSGRLQGITQAETCDISFAALALKREMRLKIGNFDEGLDGGEWCLRDYVSRVWSHGYRTVLYAASRVVAGDETVFGSDERLGELARVSRNTCLQRWGESRHYAVYFGGKTDPAGLEDVIDTLLQAARKGHRFTLLQHRRQHIYFKRMGWNALHMSIENRPLSIFFTRRDFIRQFEALKLAVPGIIPLAGADGVVYPDGTTAQSIAEVVL